VVTIGDRLPGYSLTPIGISPNAASVLGREYGCFNPAREGVARGQEGVAREQEGVARKQKGAAKKQRRARRKGPVLAPWNSVIVTQC
jgi:hypothetical protein